MSPLEAGEAISFCLKGEPVPFARARSNGKRRFTPERQAAHMRDIGNVAALAMGGNSPLAGSIGVMARFTFVAPKSWSVRRVENTRRKSSKPDIDNLFKIVADACNSIVWKDDAQIAYVQAEKVYGPFAATVVTVMNIDEPEHAVSQKAQQRDNRGRLPA